MSTLACHSGLSGFDVALPAPSLQSFEAKYKVNVRYIEDINDNDTFFGKIEGPLSQGQSIGRDIVAADGPATVAARFRLRHKPRSA